MPPTLCIILPPNGETGFDLGQGAAARLWIV